MVVYYRFAELSFLRDERLVNDRCQLLLFASLEHAPGLPLPVLDPFAGDLC